MDATSTIIVPIATSPASASLASTSPALSLPPLTPYTVIIDTREQRGFEFAQPLRIARQKKTYTVAVKRGTLTSGDYSIEGFETRVAVERKSISDLFSTLSTGRARFERELARLQEYERAAVVVEAEWSTIFREPPSRSQLPPRTVFMSVVSWQQRFPRVHWWMLPGRDVAEATTIRILDRFWREHS